MKATRSLLFCPHSRRTGLLPKAHLTFYLKRKIEGSLVRTPYEKMDYFLALITSEQFEIYVPGG